MAWLRGVLRLGRQLPQGEPLRDTCPPLRAQHLLLVGAAGDGRQGPAAP